MGSERPFFILNWDWRDVCPTGLTPWIQNSNDLASCFQQICLQIPVLILIATFSAYHFGRQAFLVVRNRIQIFAIYSRIFIVMGLAFLPVIKTYFLITNYIKIWPSDIVVACTESMTWIVHLGFLLSLRSHGSLNPRGPLFLGVLWTIALVLSATWLRTGIGLNQWQWPLLGFLLQLCYGITLLPSGKSRLISRRDTEEDERQALLGSGYIRFQDHYDEITLGYAHDGVSILSKLLFYWVNPLIDRGVLGKLRKIEDLFFLPECLSISKITEKFQKSIDGTTSLFKALHRTFGKEFYFIGIFRLLADMSAFAGPLLMGGLLKEHTTNASGTDKAPYIYAFGLFGVTLLSATCSIHFNWRITLVTLKMRTAVVTAIYRKALEARGLQGSKPEILNLMSTDTDRIVNSCISFHSFWSIPCQLIISLYLLYTQIGPAFVAGVIFAVALIPVNRWIALQIAKLAQDLMAAKDERVSLSSETLLGAKQIKLHAWEDIFVDKIQNLRKKELVFLAKRKYLDALCVYFWATTPVLMCLLTFGVSVLSGNTLNAATTFTSVALLNMLIGPLNAFPWVLNGLTEAWVSLKRVQELINLPNIDLSHYYSPVENKKSSKKEKPLVLSIHNGTFEFEFPRSREGDDLIVDDIVDFQLHSVNLDVKKKELVCLEGPVGSGKSSLISAIIANLSRSRGTICIQDVDSGFGYVAQNPWLQRGTIRENIVWGSVFDETRYRNVMFACALNEDLQVLGGDLVGVGEGGRTLSGGQRARVALARAVYQNKQIYLMDDMLSALDAHVVTHIVKHCLLGILANKTRIIVTENRTLFHHANQILHIENGIVTQSDLMNDSSTFGDEEELETESVNLTSSVKLSEEDKKSLDSVMLEETKEFGTLNPKVLWAYWRAMSNSTAFLVLLSVVLMQISRNVPDLWLAHWVSATANGSNIDNYPNLTISSSDTNHTTNYYLEIYAGLAVANSIISLARAFMFAYAGIKAAKFIHSKLLHKVFHTKLQFFDITPVGRILNRFSSDTYAIDDTLPFILNILLATVAGLIGALCITLYSMPWLTLLVVPMCPIYISLQSRYRHASRDIKRLGSNALSPLYAHFTETLQGLTTIRAMRASGRFRRDFLVKLEESIRAQLTSSAAQQWLGIRLQFLGAFLVGGAGILAAVTSAHATNSSFVGLAISYALAITSLLSGVLNALADTEQQLIAVERVNQYCSLEPEPNANGSIDAPFGWPCQGVIVFDNVVLRYREHLPAALYRVSFETAAFERVGIVGRTGAGKSSILSALLRVAPITSGKLIIDCVDISTLPLHVLRNRIALVPQEPFLFSGTIRENLDPRNEHFDSEIWSAINNCLAAPLVQSLGGLSGKIDWSGSNLSAGQRQLLCLTRALLKNSKVVCIDEGTANLDSDSEAAIQAVLRTAFKSSTVLLIAHRLNGLQHTDKIFVMDNGNIVESGTPKELKGNLDSIFYGMIQEQQNTSFYSSD